MKKIIILFLALVGLTRIFDLTVDYLTEPDSEVYTSLTALVIDLANENEELRERIENLEVKQICMGS